MKKFIIAMSIAALTVSAYAMSKTPADAKACNADKSCAVKEACPACTAAGGMCAACKAKADACKAASEIKAATCGGACAGSCGCEGKKAGKACTCDAAMKKAVEEKAGCTGSVCPLKK